MNNAAAIATGTPMIIANTEVTTVPVRALLIPNTGGPVLVGSVWNPVLVKKWSPCDLKAGRPLAKRKIPIRNRTRSVDSATSRTPPR